MSVLEDFDTAIAAARRLLGTLLKDRVLASKQRDVAVCKDFDAGLGRDELADKHREPVHTINNILHRNSRKYSTRATPISHMPCDVQRTYHKLRRCGLDRTAALSEAMKPAGRTPQGVPATAGTLPATPADFLPGSAGTLSGDAT